MNSDLPCIILAGGQSERFGSPKGLADLEGQPVISHVIERMRAQTSGPMLINGVLDGPYSDLGLTVLEDVAPDMGPLGGLLTGLKWAEQNGHTEVVTVPLDVPFVPTDLINRLADAGAVAIACSEGRVHPACGLWQVSDMSRLAQWLEDGHRSVRGWIEEIGARHVDFPNCGHDPFFNINTMKDLENARGIVRALARGTTT